MGMRFWGRSGKNWGPTKPLMAPWKQDLAVDLKFPPLKWSEKGSGQVDEDRHLLKKKKAKEIIRKFGETKKKLYREQKRETFQGREKGGMVKGEDVTNRIHGEKRNRAVSRR